MANLEDQPNVEDGSDRDEVDDADDDEFAFLLNDSDDDDEVFGDDEDVSEDEDTADKRDSGNEQDLNDVRHLGDEQDPADEENPDNVDDEQDLSDEEDPVDEENPEDEQLPDDEQDPGDEQIPADEENPQQEQNVDDEQDPDGVNENDVINDNVNVQNPAEININNVEQEVRESPQETLFMGINTVGTRVPLEYKEEFTAIDHILISLSRFVRHNNTYVNLIDEFKWIKKLFRNINIPTTKKALWKTLGRSKENVIYTFFCSQCKAEIGQGAIEIRCPCGLCGPEENEAFLAVFVQIRLRPQIIDLFRIPNIADALRYRDNRSKLDNDAMEDIYDGEMYKKECEPGEFLSEPYNYSFTLWTDGLKLTKSSRATTYPIILQLNELSPHARKKHLFITGLWIADEHPIMNAILRPTVNELRDLHENGIAWRPDGRNEVVSRFIVTTFTADSVARPDVLRMKRFNGINGCQSCLAPGQMVDNRRVYAAAQYAMRQDAQIRRDGLLAIATGRPVRGVKGLSSLARLPQFDLVDGVVIDPAHNPFLGVAKRLVERFLTDADEEWYIGSPRLIAAIDDRLLTIKPPTRISRTPRSITTYRMWKASEWRNWLLYYALPCLHGILPDDYFNHLTLLCTAIFILNSSSITEQQFNHARDLIARFVEDYETLYRLTNMLFNVHILNHLVQSARNWGPLWVFSTLPFESLNKKITDSIKSPLHRGDQIITRFFIKKFVCVASRLVEIAEETREETNRLLGIKNEHLEGMIEGQYFRGIGKREIRHPEIEEVNLVREAGFIINPLRNIAEHKKVIINGVEYREKDDVRRKFCNYIAFCKRSRRCGRIRFYVIEKIISYLYGEETVAGFIGKRLQSNGDAYGTPHMQYVIELEEREFVSFKNVISPGFFIPSSREPAVVSLSNVWETD